MRLTIRINGSESATRQAFAVLWVDTDEGLLSSTTTATFTPRRLAASSARVTGGDVNEYAATRIELRAAPIAFSTSASAPPSGENADSTTCVAGASWVGAGSQRDTRSIACWSSDSLCVLPKAANGVASREAARQAAARRLRNNILDSEQFRDSGP
jgi:hypothetical protein